MPLPTANEIRTWPTSKLVTTLASLTANGIPRSPDARARIATEVASELDRRIPREASQQAEPMAIGYVERAHRRTRRQKDDPGFLDRVLAMVPDLVASGKIRRVGSNTLDCDDLTDDESSRLLHAETSNRGHPPSEPCSCGHVGCRVTKHRGD